MSCLATQHKHPAERDPNLLTLSITGHRVSHNFCCIHNKITTSDCFCAHPSFMKSLEEDDQLFASVYFNPVNVGSNNGMIRVERRTQKKFWVHRWDSNPRPSLHLSDVLTIELVRTLVVSNSQLWAMWRNDCIAQVTLCQWKQVSGVVIIRRPLTVS